MALPRRVFALLAVCAMAAGTLFVSAHGTAAATPAKPGDFNGDGYPDLAVGAPGTTVNGYLGAGAVSVVYGTANGLDTTKRQRLQQGVSWVPGSPGLDESFGGHTAGDFNGDGYSDLAICAPGQRRGTDGNGELMLAFGSSAGLNRAYELVPPAQQPIQEYCLGLTSGDFDSDGFMDIVVRSGDQYVAPLQVISGGPEADHRSKLELSWIPQTTRRGELSAGDITGDGYADLLVGAGFNKPEGGLTLYKGAAGGLTTTPAQQVTTPGSSQTAVGDVDGDGYADVAAANSVVGPSGIKQAGLVRLWFGSSRGLDTARGFTLITQDTAGVPDVAELGDRFGGNLAIGDADGDTHADLAIAVPSEDVGSSNSGIDGGAVTVIYGSESGLDFSRTNHFTQDSAGIPDTVERYDAFGAYLQFRELDQVTDGRANLLVGVPSEDLTADDEGAVFVFEPTAGGLTGQGTVMIGPRQVGIAPASAFFGALG